MPAHGVVGYHYSRDKKRYIDENTQEMLIVVQQGIKLQMLPSVLIENFGHLKTRCSSNKLTDDILMSSAQKIT